MSDAQNVALSTRVERHRAGGSDVWALALDVPDAVSFAGSLVTGADLGTSERQMQRFAARLLDRGSERRDRFEIAEWLESRGASLHFSSQEGRVAFSGRALRADVPEVIALAAELLAHPSFDADEVEKVRRELDASIRQARSDTGFLAGAALSRRVYDPRHPGYRMPLDEKAQQLAAIGRDDLVAFHRSRMAPRPVLLALAGDLTGLDPAALLGHFPDATPASAPPPPGVATHVEGRERLDVADKPNLDVQIGQGVALARHDADFIPLYVGLYALGGNFSARLMQDVRDKRGLTYGIRAGMEYVDKDQQGHWSARATFSTADLARGIEATMDVLRQWVDEGLTPEETESVRETLLGTYDVSLSSTGALASRLLTRAEQGFGPDYLDGYRDELRAATTAQINEAIRRHVYPDAVLVASAGAHPAP